MGDYPDYEHDGARMTTEYLRDMVDGAGQQKAQSVERRRASADEEAWVLARLETAMNLCHDLRDAPLVGAEQDMGGRAIRAVLHGCAAEIIRTLGMEPGFVNIDAGPNEGALSAADQNDLTAVKARLLETEIKHQEEMRALHAHYLGKEPAPASIQRLRRELRAWWERFERPMQNPDRLSPMAAEFNRIVGPIPLSPEDTVDG